MFKQPFIQFQQADHRTHQAHIPAAFPPRRHSSQQPKGGLGSPHQHFHPQHHDDQQRHGKQREHSTPRLHRFDARLSKSQLPFYISESLLTAKASAVFISRL